MIHSYRYIYTTALAILLLFSVNAPAQLSIRNGTYLESDHYVGGGLTIAYLTDGYTKTKFVPGIKIYSEAQKHYRRGLTFQVSYFYPINEEMNVATGPSDYYSYSNPDQVITYKKATLKTTFSNVSLGQKKYLTGSYKHNNSIYFLWDFGLGFASTKFEIDNYDITNETSPYEETFARGTSVLGFAAAGFGFRRRVDNFEFFWELKGHYFLDTFYLEDQLNDYEPQYILEKTEIVKSVPNYYAINFGARIII